MVIIPIRAKLVNIIKEVKRVYFSINIRTNEDSRVIINVKNINI